MHRTTTRLLSALAAALVVWTGIAAVAMVSQLADAADRLWLGSGQWLFFGLMALLVVAVLVPSVMLARMPPALRYPGGGDAAALAHYQQQLRTHLARNPRVAHMPLHTPDEVQAALHVLQQAAEQATQTTAASVLASTALLQNGRLDGLLVLVQQVRLVWRIARIYGLRPSVRQLSYLYANVGACMLLADSLDALDISALSAPLVHAAVPAALGSVPGMGGVGSLLVNSLASGSANAFLTLRVGLMACAYCAPLHQPVQASIRTSATVRAAQLLGQLVKDGASRISQAVVGKLKSTVVQTAQDAAASVRDSAQATSQQSTRTVQDTISRLQTAVESWTPKGKP